VSGRLALTCAVRDGRSRIAHVRYEGLARVSRAQRDGDAAHVVVAHLGPGILGGDAYHTGVRVEAGAALVVTGQMATPVYARAAPSSVHAAWTVERDALLVVRAEPLMLDTSARHDVTTSIDVASGGCAIVADIVTVGPGACARMRTSARIDGRLVARDACDLGAPSAAVATLLVVCADDARRAAFAASIESILAAAGDTRGGIGATPGALLVRATGARVWPLVRLVDDLISALRPRPRALASTSG
jgi:urease accessory protein UreH